MKKITSLFIALMMLATLVVVPVSVNASGFDGIPATAFAGGTGTEADPYLISSAAELAYAEDLMNGQTKINGAAIDRKSYFKLTADIDFNNQEWEPFGHSTGGSRGLKGGFDGNGHVIRNLKITKSQNETGFFGYAISGAVIKDLGIENLQIEAANKDSATISAIGGFIGYVQNSGTSITNCYIKNSSLKQTNPDSAVSNGMGAFLGYGYDGAKVSNCYAYNVEIGASYYGTVGGFAGGCQFNGSVSAFENCYAAQITASSQNTVYGFGNGKGKTVSATECYSTLNNAEGISQFAPDYVASYSVGNTGATKTTIANAFDDVDGFCVSDNVNNGYPCFGWEVFDGVAADSFAGGDGSETTPYLISNAAELKRMSDLFNGTSKDYREKFFKLTADIDYGNCEWEPIGHKDGYSLKGGFDGAGHVIRNIKITKPYAEVGFFGYIYGAEVKDLGIENINIKFKTSGTNNVGAFIGYNQAGTITNCYVKNATIHQTDTKTKEASFGAFVGMVRSTAQIENCYIYDAKIASSYQTAMGGFVGSLYDTTAVKINNCFAAEVTPIENPAQNSVYGFGSKNGKSGFTVTNCYSTLASAEGTYSDSYTTVYAESNSLGNAGASKADITTYFNTLDGFAVTSDVNGGYPCLVREVDCVIKSVADNGVVRVIKNIPTAATVYVATYDGYGRLVDVKASPVSEADFTFTPDGLVTSETLKVFVWDGNNIPVADMYTN